MNNFFSGYGLLRLSTTYQATAFLLANSYYSNLSTVWRGQNNLRQMSGYKLELNFFFVFSSA